MKTITVKQYYEAFTRAEGLPVLVPILFPAFSQLLSERDTPTYLCPPLGDHQDVFLIITCFILAAVTWRYFRFIQSTKRRRRFPSVSVVVVVSAIVFFVSNMIWVKHIYYDAENKDVSVSVGFERSAYEKALFKDKVYTDSELLHLSGTDEDLILKLWTIRSIVIVRLLLWLSYASFLGGLVWMMSSMAYRHAVDDASQPKGATDAHR
jgi:hypothetical protein